MAKPKKEGIWWYASKKKGGFLSMRFGTGRKGYWAARRYIKKRDKK